MEFGGLQLYKMEILTKVWDSLGAPNGLELESNGYLDTRWFGMMMEDLDGCLV